MAKRRKKKAFIHHKDTRIVTSKKGGHSYMVAHRAGQESEAIKVIEDWVKNPELNITAAEASPMVSSLKGVVEYEAMVAQHKMEREEKKKRREG